MEFNKERSLYLNDDINSHSSMELLSGMSKLHSAAPTDLITLFITSTGGNVSDAFALYEYITKLLKPNLQTVVLGEASSLAIMLFLAGEQRYVGEMAVMRFHRFNFTVEKGVSLTAKQAEKIYQNLDRAEERYIEIVVCRSDNIVSAKKAKALLDNDVMVPALKAVDLGLAHEIL